MVRRHVICNITHRIEDLSAGDSPPRYGLGRQLIATADRHIVVAAPTPVGIARLLDWLATAAALLGENPVHVVINGGPPDRFRRGEILEELTRSAAPTRVWFVPDDGHVTTAAWRGELPAPGPFTRAVGAIAEVVLPTETRVSRRRGRRWRR